MLSSLVLAAVVAASPPPYLVSVWNTDRGLPQNTINAAVQTRDGYLWLATFGGLARFDGHAFTLFTSGNTPGLGGSRITALLEDRDGALWIGTENDGVARLRDGRFTSYGREAGLPSLQVRTIAQDTRGTIWIGGSGGLARWTGERFAAEPLPATVPHLDVLALLGDRHGRLWAGTRGGLALFDGGRTRGFTVADGLPDAGVSALGEDADGAIWIGTIKGLSRWDGGDRIVADNRLALEAPALIDFIGWRQQALWIAARSHGLFRCEGASCAAVPSLPDASARSVLEDREGNLWVGLANEGLARLKPPRVQPRPVVTPGRVGSVVPVVTDGSGGLYIGGTCGGLFHWRPEGTQVFGKEAGFANDCVWALARDRDGSLWVGTAGEGLYRWKDRVLAHYGAGSGIVGSTISALAFDRSGRLWIGGGSGVSMFDGVSFKNYTYQDGLLRAPVRFITEDREGAIWIGSVGGASRLKDGRFTNFTIANGLPNNYVRAIHEDPDGLLWFGTFGGGLARYKDGRFVAIGTRQGLLDDVVSRIIEDHDGNFWMSGMHGIFRVTRKDLNAVADGTAASVTAASYTVGDGMLTNEANGGGQPAGVVGDNGHLFFPTTRGIVEIDPARRDRLPPPVYVERVVTPRYEAGFQNGVTLPPGRGDLEFHYTAISLSAPEKVRFQYRLDGYDASWIDAGDRRAAYYTNVPAGSHVFRVRAMNGDGQWSQADATAGFAVAPYVYQRPWFMALGGLFVVSGGLAFARLRTAQLTRRTRELEDKVAARTAEVVEQKDRLADAHAQLERAFTGVESANRNLLSLLNELRVGALTTDHEGRVTFVSATAAPLVASSGAADGSFWFDALPVAEAERERLRDMASRPPGSRTKMPLRMEGDAGRQYWMEIEIKDDPRDPASKIVLLYDVSEVYDLRLLLDDRSHAHGIVGQSAVIQLLLKQIQDAARVDTTVLVEGETGSGKELVARAIHDASDRRQRPFVAVNCAGLTESLVSSQLFGHRRGAFTGASDDHAGLFESANKGTIFLDEIGDMPPAAQMMLLRVLQEREITRVGDSRPRPIDVRVIAATHRDLPAEVEAGRFRQDLLYRIRVARIAVPPLRDRRQDIPLLVSWFLGRARADGGKPIHDVSADVMDALMRYAWPGNVRELRGAIDSARVGARGPVLQASDLPREVIEGADRRAGAQEPKPPAMKFAGGEREQIEAALARAGGNRAAAARLLGISRATFYRRLRDLEIDAG